MKYYIRLKNTKTNKSMIMSIPVFTNRERAQEWADEFVEIMNRDTQKAEAEVIKENEKTEADECIDMRL